MLDISSATKKRKTTTPPPSPTETIKKTKLDPLTHATDPLTTPPTHGPNHTPTSSTGDPLTAPPPLDSPSKIPGILHPTPPSTSPLLPSQLPPLHLSPSSVTENSSENPLLLPAQVDSSALGGTAAIGAAVTVVEEKSGTDSLREEIKVLKEIIRATAPPAEKTVKGISLIDVRTRQKLEKSWKKPWCFGSYLTLEDKPKRSKFTTVPITQPVDPAKDPGIAELGKIGGNNDKSLQPWNIGYQLLLKMGWNYSGLGKFENGTLHPIEVRFNTGSRGLGAPEKRELNISKHCEICDTNIIESAWESHINGKKHRKNLAQSEPKLIECVICGLTLDKSTYQSHIAGKKHYKRLMSMGIPLDNNLLTPQQQILDPMAFSEILNSQENQFPVSQIKSVTPQPGNTQNCGSNFNLNSHFNIVDNQNPQPLNPHLKLPTFEELNYSQNFWNNINPNNAPF